MEYHAQSKPPLSARAYLAYYASMSQADVSYNHHFVAEKTILSN